MDLNIFEGMTVQGVPVATLSQGAVVYAKGQLRAVRGAGRYVNRPAFPPLYEAAKKAAQRNLPHAVVRA